MQRWAKAHDAAAYVQSIASGKIPIEQWEVISASQALEEELFLGLRQLAGIDLDRLQKVYGVLLSDRFQPLESSGLLERDGSVVRLAAKHLSISNEVFVELMR
jgi:oxygen-independent coproporphyrinogen-3 oxidase